MARHSFAMATSILALAATLMSAPGSALATACTSATAGLTIGHTTDVTVNSISIAGQPGSLSVNYAAAECVGSYSGNSIPYPKLNLGYAGDGLFNGAQQDGGGPNPPTLFPNGIFPDQYTAVDLNHDGKPDPGWIYLGSWLPGAGFSPATIGGVSTIVLSNWFSVTQNAAGNGGAWAFTPDANVVSRVLPVLGPNLFDQFALSFMSGDRFAAYDFTGKEFGLPISPNTIYNFSGFWDMSNTLFNNGRNAGTLSHVDLWVRDPNGGGNRVPEPTTLWLLGLALLGLTLALRRKH